MKIHKVIFLVILGLLLTTSACFALWTIDNGISTGSGQAMTAYDPSAIPAAGTYTSSQTVSLSATDSNSIRYTINGSTPSCSSGTVYSTAITVGSTQTIKAISCYDDGDSTSTSNVISYLYTINISTGGGGGGGSYVSPPTDTTTTSAGEPLVLSYAQEGTLTKTFTDNSEIVIEIPICTVEAETTFDVEQKALVNYEAPVATVGAILVGNTVFEITAVDTENVAVTSFYRAITITITIPDLPEDTSSLGLYYYNHGTDSWGLIPGAQFDPVTGEVTFTTDHFTKFAVFEITDTPYFLSVDLSLVGVEGISERDLVKTNVSSAVYQILNGKYHIFPHLEVYRSWGYVEDFSTVKTITAAELEQYPEGDAVPFRDGSLFRGTTQSVHDKSASAVFYVENGKLRAVQSAEIYQGLFNDSDWSLVTWVPDDLLDKFIYPLGEEITTIDTHPNGCLIKYADSPAIYLIENGQKRQFTSWNALVANGYKGRPILTLPDTEIYETTEVIRALSESLITPVFAALTE